MSVRSWNPVEWCKAHPQASDALLAVVVTAATLPAQWLTPTGEADTVFRGPNVLGAVLLLLYSLPVAWRRRWPIPVLAVTGSAGVLYELLGYATVGVPWGVLIAMYTVAAHCRRPVSLRALGVVGAAIVLILFTARWDVDTGIIASNIIIFVTVWLIGDNLQTRRAFVASLQERAVRAEETRVAEAQRAVAEERTRIARELHDVVAHSMSVMVVQAAGRGRRADP
jgi:signal transduction histidine kinase